MKGLKFINELRAQGHFSFTITEGGNALNLKKYLALMHDIVMILNRYLRPD